MTNNDNFANQSGEIAFHPAGREGEINLASRSLFRRILITSSLLSLTVAALAFFFVIATYQEVVNQYVALSDLEAINRNIRFQILLIFFLVIIITTFSSLLLARSIAFPIQKLVRGIDRIKKGDLNFSIDARSEDEVGALARSFNDMVARLREQRERERALDEVKGQFITVAAHQLRTPLSAMKWSLTMLLEGDVGVLTPPQREMIERGSSSTERMIRLVNDLLDVSRLEEGRFGFIFKKEDLIAALGSLARDEEIKARAKGVNFTFENKIPGPLIMNIDASKIALACANLIENAINYTPRGGDVRLIVSKTSDDVSIAVSDTGVGIPAHQINRLFSKFFRGDNVVKMQTEGSGLGLYIVRNIAERHNGSVEVDSREGRGSIFVIRLPIEGRKEEEGRYQSFVESI